MASVFIWPRRQKGLITRSTCGEALLHNCSPASYLPHRTPFLFIDRVISLVPGERASGVKLVTWEPACFPPVFLIESMAQLAGIAAGEAEGEGGFLAAVEHGEFFATVRSGDSLLVAVRIVKSFGRLYLVEGEVTVGERKVAVATLTLGVGKV